MGKNILYVIFFVFLLYSCHNKNDDDKKADFYFDLIVDTTFICDINIDEERDSFINTHTDGFSQRLYGSDSIIFGFSLFFKTEHKEITIRISEDFDVDDLGLQFEGNYKPVPYNYLPSQIFLDIFSKEYYESAKFRYMDNGGIWYVYTEAGCVGGNGQNWLQDIGEISIGYEDRTGIYDTKYLNTTLSEDSIKALNSKSFFEINSIDILNECSLIIEGQFECYITNYCGKQLYLKCNHFKGYVKNIIQCHDH